MNSPDTHAAGLDAKTIAAQQACIDHARDLLSSARAVQAVGHHNIAYHLAALALEERGRGELIGVQSISRLATVPPAWPNKHTQDHVKKLFWCFFGGGFFAEQITAQSLEEMAGLAHRIHETRLLGLYVDHGEDGLSIPSEAVGKEEVGQLITLATACLRIAESEKLREQ